MHLTPSITIREIPKSEAIEANIVEKIEKLDQFYTRIMHCDVVVEPVQKHKHQGKLYNCRISVTVPSGECVVNHHNNEDAYVAIRDAFRAMRRKIKSFNHKRRGDVKVHEIPLHGYVARIIPDDGFGFIECNGSEYYFSRDNVAYPDFDDLQAGMSVQFLESLGSDGLQARRITTGKHQGIEY